MKASLEHEYDQSRRAIMNTNPNVRRPPRLATWLLQHVGEGYHSEALAGDLFEEFQNGRTAAWYWHQTMAALAAAGLRAVRLLVTRVAASALLVLLTEAAAVIGALALSQEFRQICSVESLLRPSALVAVVGTLALIVSVGMYVTTIIRPTTARKQMPMKRRVMVFAVTALSAGTLTWASTNGETRCGAQACVCRGAVVDNKRATGMPHTPASSAQIAGPAQLSPSPHVSP
jgi:hypothetical protein